MKERIYIETIGTISKKETLASLEDEFSDKYLVLENLHPFPGYYHKTVPDTKSMNPESIFIITKRNYSEEKIFRATNTVRKQFKDNFRAAPGKVTVFNIGKPCIRIKQLGDYKMLPQLLEEYKKQGIEFVKHKKVPPYEGLIKIKKFFLLNDSGKGYYLDTREPNMCYFEIPQHIRWSEFERITIDIKQNTDNNKFDAALGTLYKGGSLIDIVRIYDEHIDSDKIGKIKKRFLDAIKKIQAK